MSAFPLRACPFCGYDELELPDEPAQNDTAWSVWCPSCDAFGPAGFDANDAGKRWNGFIRESENDYPIPP